MTGSSKKWPFSMTGFVVIGPVFGAVIAALDDASIRAIKRAFNDDSRENKLDNNALKYYHLKTLKS